MPLEQQKRPRETEMTKIDLDSMSLEDLESLRGDVDKAITSFKARRLKEAQAAAADLAKEYGFSLEEIVSAKGSKKPTAPAKYKNPENDQQTWSGRGRQPKWFKDAVDAGKIVS
jgi:DNA-binding protein H-NS